jgi:replicative DNA helicase
MKSTRGLGLVVIDNLDAMRSVCRNDSREQEISDIVRSLKDLAKEIHVPVVILSQARGEVDVRTNKSDLMSALRASGNLDHDADVIVFLQRDLDHEKADSLTQEDNLAKILIAKQRRGSAAVVTLRFLREFATFENPRDIPKKDEFMSVMAG